MSKVKILLVDDEQNFLTASKIYLEKRRDNYHIETCLSATEALALLEKNPFEVIISDYQMPNMTGLAFLKELKKRGDTSIFIVFTGKGREEVAMEALNLGADYYLQKGGGHTSQFTELINLIDQSVAKKRTEKELRESELRYRSFVESFQGIAFRRRIDGILILFHGAVKEITGYTEEEFLRGKPLWEEIIFPQDLRELQKLEKGIYSISEDFTHREYRIVRKDGKIRWIREYLKKIPVPAKQATIIQGTIHDITHHKKVEEERERYLQELRLINDTIIRVSRMNDNDEICQLIGKTVHSLNKEAYIFVSLFDRDIGAIRVRAIVGLDEKELLLIINLLGELSEYSGYYDEKDEEAKLYTTGKIEFIPGGLNHLTAGKLSPESLEKIERAILWEGNYSAYAIGFALEDKPYGGISLLLPKGKEVQHQTAIETLASHISIVLQHKQTEEQLTISKHRLNAFINSSSDLIFLKDNHFKHLLVNEAYCQFLAKKREEIIGKTDFELLPDKLARQCRQSDKKVLETKKMTVVEETSENKIFETQKFPVKLSTGETGIGGIIREITQKKKRIQSLQLHHDFVQEQRDELEAFASTVAHDIRSKLQIISAYNELNKGTEYSTKIDLQIKEINRFLENLLELAKQGKILGNLEVINLNHLLTEVIKDIQPLAPGLTILQRKLPVIKGDPIKLRQVFENLLMNVVKHAEASKVEIAAEENEEDYSISIQDNGRGISQERQQRLLNLLANKEHTASGLLIVTKVIEAHKGRITFESTEGKGTKVIISFPKNKK
ncbi:MAG: PAS domain S-box protein [Candidatus Heimdallarchaeota archaeon]|nr:PAS domain S-box protein [Candidatus Heimdallarchaeota archaeon]